MNRATIYRYESDAIEMPASMLQPLADALNTSPDDLMDWRLIKRNITEREKKMDMILSQLDDGISSEGSTYPCILWKNIDFATGAITIAGNLCYTSAKGVYLDTPKSGHTRIVYVGDHTLALLRQLRIEQSQKCLSTYVFTKETSPEPMHPQGPTRYLKKFSERYGIPDLHPHKLRHTFASIDITNGADVASVSETLGHSDKAVTLRMYTHADQESISQAAQIVREAIKKAGQG